MSKSFYDGDEWKYAKGEHNTGLTRAEAQQFTDSAYARGEITLQEWRETTQFLSEPPPQKVRGTV